MDLVLGTGGQSPSHCWEDLPEGLYDALTYIVVALAARPLWHGTARMLSEHVELLVVVLAVDGPLEVAHLLDQASVCILQCGC